MKLVNSILLILIVSSCPFLLHAEQEWQLAKNEQGVKVYTRSSELSDFKEFKAVTTIKGSVDKVFATITDPSRLTYWMADTIYAEVLETGSGKQSVYVINEVPFPLQNRDGVFEYTVDKSIAGVIYIEVTSGDPAIKANDKYVRITSAKGYWLIEKAEKGSQVTYQLLLDPGGSVPSWIANSQVVSVPFRTLVNLHKEMSNSD